MTRLVILNTESRLVYWITASQSVISGHLLNVMSRVIPVFVDQDRPSDPLLR